MLLRWLKFNAVGGLGIVVQLAALALFRGALGISYLPATALAVETAVLHNFIWHERWTWRDRPGAGLGRLLRFNATTGALSIAANVLLMRVFVGSLGLHYLPANLLSIALCSVANFLLSDRWVFRRHAEERPSQPVSRRTGARAR